MLLAWLTEHIFELSAIKQSLWEWVETTKGEMAEGVSDRCLCSVGNAQHSNAGELRRRVRKALHEMYGCMLSIEPLFQICKEHVGHYLTYRASLGWWNISTQFSIPCSGAISYRVRLSLASSKTRHYFCFTLVSSFLQL